MSANDLRFSCRLLRRDPVYALASTITLALAVAAATAVYAVVDATLVRPLPYRSPERLVAVGVLARAPDGSEIPFGPSQPELVRWRAATHAFESIDAVEPRIVAMTGDGEAQALKAAAVLSGLFATLGVEPIRGRTFTAEEERADEPRAVISEALSRRRFHGSDSIANAVIELDGRAFDVVGVMPSGFAPMLVTSDVWVPLHPIDDPVKANARVMNGIGRLRPGVDAAGAERELMPMSAALAREYPAVYRQVRPNVMPLRRLLFGPDVPAIAALAGAVALLLALAAVNVMNLTLGHLARRRDEFGVRAMLGATRWRTIRLQLVETSLVAAAGGGIGFWMVDQLLPPLLRVYAAAGQTPIDARLDWRVAAFGVAVTAITAAVCGIAPAIRAHASALEGGAVGIRSPPRRASGASAPR
jgi:putative ABC transport system permease protein